MSAPRTSLGRHHAAHSGTSRLARVFLAGLLSGSLAIFLFYDAGLSRSAGPLVLAAASPAGLR